MSNKTKAVLGTDKTVLDKEGVLENSLPLERDSELLFTIDTPYFSVNSSLGDSTTPSTLVSSVGNTSWALEDATAVTTSTQSTGDENIPNCGGLSHSSSSACFSPWSTIQSTIKQPVMNQSVHNGSFPREWFQGISWLNTSYYPETQGVGMRELACVPDMGLLTDRGYWTPCVERLGNSSIVPLADTPLCCLICGGCYHNDTCWQCPSNSWDITPSPRQTFYEEEMANAIWSWVSPIILILGTIGNILSAYIMSQKPLRRSVTALYLSVLAVVDTLVLYTGLLRYWIKAISGVDIRNQSQLTCRLHAFLVYWFTDLAVWIIVIVTLERFINVQYPHKARIYCNKMTAVISMVAVALALGGTNIHFLWTNELVASSSHGITRYMCHVKREYQSFRENVWPWLDFSVFSLMPFLVLITFNLCIVVILARAHYRRRALNVVGGQLPRMTTMTGILLLVSLTLFVLTAPISLFLVGPNTWMKSSDPRSVARQNFWWAICNQLAYTNNAINFLLYCLSGARFRRELRTAFCRRNAVHPEMAPPATLSTRAGLPTNAVAPDPQSQMVPSPEIPQNIPDEPQE